MYSSLSTHLIRKNFVSVAVIGLLMLFAGVFFVSIPVAHAATSCTSGVGASLLVDVTQQIANDPDSGFFGDWALDNFTRHIQIWEESGIYCAQADDVGTFTTFGGANGKSPQSGIALPEIVTGTMTGGTRGVLTGTFGDAGVWGTTGTAPAQDCNSISCSMTSLWVQNYFPGGSYDYSTAPEGDWSWTYDGGANGTWVNAASGSTGDIVHVVLSSVYVAPGGNDSNDGSVTHPFATIQAAVDAVPSGGTITVATGTYTLTSKIDITKTDLTITGAGVGSTFIQGDITVGENFFKILASGFTLQNIELVKTDKTGLQNLLYIGASNTSIKNSSIHGQFVIGDGDVSRAMVFTGGLTGIQIDGNTIYALRQPGYLTGPTTGTISNNFVYGTKGWVLEGGDITMTGNTWGFGAQANVYDIAILSMAPTTAYANILSMSAANNNAFIEDQR
nr:hypothetical protein [Candidatus Paceibacterota bacterium]